MNIITRKALSIATVVVAGSALVLGSISPASASPASRTASISVAHKLAARTAGTSPVTPVRPDLYQGAGVAIIWQMPSWENSTTATYPEHAVTYMSVGPSGYPAVQWSSVADLLKTKGICSSTVKDLRVTWYQTDPSLFGSTGLMHSGVASAGADSALQIVDAAGVSSHLYKTAACPK